MIGVIQLVVEINYDEMLKEENLKAIHGYTGIQTPDEMMKSHLNNIGNKLANTVDGLPYVKYNVDGQFYPMPEQPQSEAVEEKVEDEETASPYMGEDEVEEIVAEKLDTSESIKENDVLARLNKDLDAVSVEHGIPQAIKVNGEFIECLKKEVASISDVESPDEVPSHYMGFELRVEGMEEPYEIEFKPYDGTDLRTFSYKIEPKNP
ncbi:hypothetical protein [Bacillus gaemokensis]|uniref:Uncharacterized protein n=1 Tax=Bacillus gaemokensis TaxID=574375 RepID=A0A073KBQ3_9BACI|nr:hypothetical protein [Bacillus gaemokensis]KEK23887.1 hypothetical protein BAGA_05445 [Bacillus gaemokensis]KYG38128.1 hypothetical protein AZF08_20480 [Bacillus gaemokensis]